MSNVNTLVEKALALKAVAQTDLELITSDRRPGMAARKAAAEQDLSDLKKLLAMALATSGGAIYVDGPGAEEFVAIAEDEAGAVRVRADDLYETLANYTEAGFMGTRTMRIDGVVAFLGAVHRTLRPLGIVHIQPPDLQKAIGRDFPTHQSVVDMAREVMRKAVGDELNQVYMLRKLPDVLVDRQYDAKYPGVPVIVTGATPAEVDGDLGAKLFGGRKVVFTAPTNVDRNDVILVFKKLWKLFGAEKKSPMQRAFEATPEEMGRAAVAAAKHEGLPSHATHGRGTSEDGPDDSDCGCRGGTEESACAAAGCGFCKATTIEAASASSTGDAVPHTKRTSKRSTKTKA